MGNPYAAKMALIVVTVIGASGFGVRVLFPMCRRWDDGDHQLAVIETNVIRVSVWWLEITMVVKETWIVEAEGRAWAIFMRKSIKMKFYLFDCIRKLVIQEISCTIENISKSFNLKLFRSFTIEVGNSYNRVILVYLKTSDKFKYPRMPGV